MTESLSAEEITALHDEIFIALVDEQGDFINPPCSYAPEMWFPSDSSDYDAQSDLCDSCPAKAACLTYAIGAKEQDGIWGGIRNPYRWARRMERQRAKRAAAAS